MTDLLFDEKLAKVVADGEPLRNMEYLEEIGASGDDNSKDIVAFLERINTLCGVLLERKAGRSLDYSPISEIAYVSIYSEILHRKYGIDKESTNYNVKVSCDWIKLKRWEHEDMAACVQMLSDATVILTAQILSGVNEITLIKALNSVEICITYLRELFGIDDRVMSYAIDVVLDDIKFREVFYE